MTETTKSTRKNTVSGVAKTVRPADLANGATATSTEKSRALSPVEQKFVLHWGEMGTRWGINRTVAQVHALLFLSQRPLRADEIAATLAGGRSNGSNSLRELQ